MIVTCENCDTNFNLDESLVKITGSKVRCSKCKHIFTAYPPKPSEAGLSEEPDDLESAAGGDLDTDIMGDSNFSDEQMLDEMSSETDEPDDLDLSDIEKMLDVEEDAEEDMVTEDDSASDGPGYDAVGDSLDLSDIEKILDDEALGDDLPVDKSNEDPDLIFDLDEAIEMEAGEDQLSPTSELDLGDLEKMFESEDEEPDFSLEDEPSLSDELEADDADNALLSTEEDDASEELEIDMEGQASAIESEESEETLDFDMEPVGEGEAPQPPSEEEDLVLDFDLEDEEEALLEEPDIKAPDSDGDMDFELEMEEEAESVVPEVGETDMPVEDALGEPRDESVGGPDAEVLDEEPSDLDEETEFDLSDDTVPDIPDEETELDFPDDAVPDIPDEEEVLMDEEESIQEEDLDEGEDVSEEIIPRPAEEKSGLKKFVALVTIAVIVIALAALVILQRKGIVHVPYLDKVELPYIGKLKAPEAPEPGNMKIRLSEDVDKRFLDDSTAGRLFIATGKVKNEYSQPRSYIQVSGSLYTRGKMLASTVTAYCGNVIADLELSKMTAVEIQARLENRPGELNANVNVKPGEERPFMIVFSDLPESLEELAVAVVGSSEGDK